MIFINTNILEPIYNTCVEEKETIISISGNDNVLKIYTSDNSMLTRLKKILKLNPDTVKYWEAGRCEGKVTGYFFTMPKKHFSLRSTAGREVSEEQREAASKRFKKLAAEGKLGRKSN